MQHRVHLFHITHHALYSRVMYICLTWLLWQSHPAFAQPSQKQFATHWNQGKRELANNKCFRAIGSFYRALRTLSTWPSLNAGKKRTLQNLLAQKLSICYLRVGPGMHKGLHPIQRTFWYKRFLWSYQRLPKRQKTKLSQLMRLYQPKRKTTRRRRARPSRRKTRPSRRRSARVRRKSRIRALSFNRVERWLLDKRKRRAISALRKQLPRYPKGTKGYLQIQTLLRFLYRSQSIDNLLRDQQETKARKALIKLRADVSGLPISTRGQSQLLRRLTSKITKSHLYQAGLSARGLQCKQALYHWLQGHQAKRIRKLSPQTKQALYRCYQDAGKSEAQSRHWTTAMATFRRPLRLAKGRWLKPKQRVTLYYWLARSHYELSNRERHKAIAHRAKAKKLLREYFRRSSATHPQRTQANQLQRALKVPLTIAKTRQFDVELGLGATFVPAVGFQAIAAFDYYPIPLLGLRLEAGLDTTDPMLGQIAGGAMLVLGDTWQFHFKLMAGVRLRNGGAGFQLSTGPGIRYRLDIGLQIGLAVVASFDLYQEQWGVLLSAHTTIGYAF